MENDLRPRLTQAPPEERERKDLRGFGAGLGLILFFFAWKGRAHGHAASLASIGALSLLLAGLRPGVFRPLYRAWMPVVGILARVNLWLLCAILYYLVVTPYGLLLRAFGMRPLDLRLRSADSYWVEVPARDPAESARSIF